jgi:serine/threonine protein kinase
VHLLQVYHDGVLVAAKRMETSGVDARQRNELLHMLKREFLALRKLVHPNIVRMIGVSVDDASFLCLVMEIAEGGSLQALIASRRALVLGCIETQIAFSMDIAAGLAYLHSRSTPVLTTTSSLPTFCYPAWRQR